MTRVLVVGSINMDLVMQAPRLPAPGETLVGGVFSTVPGGKGANQAVAAARLGCSVRLVGAVGSDSFGEIALQNLSAAEVDTSEVAPEPDQPTGVAIILVDEEGRNTIVVASGANALVSPDRIAAGRALFQWADVVVLQCEIPLPTVTATVKAAEAAGATVVLNAAPAVSELPDAAFRVDYLVVNESEAEALSGLRPATIEDALAAAHQLRARGAAGAVVTLGAQGCVYSDARCSGHVPTPVVKAVDTTAAGDAFVGALAAALGRGLPLKETLLYANCAGALATTKLGAQTSLPDAAAVDRLFATTRSGGVPT